MLRFLLALFVTMTMFHTLNAQITSDEQIRPFRMFARRSVGIVDAERCSAIVQSRHAQFFEEHAYVPEHQANDNREDMDERVEQSIKLLTSDGEPKRRLFDYNMSNRNSRLERIARTLRSSKYAPKMCNPETFYPTVSDGSESPISCYQICASCVSGSLAVCHQRNHRFPGIGQTCFCTFDYESPLHKAVLVLKNSPHKARTGY